MNHGLIRNIINGGQMFFSLSNTLALCIGLIFLNAPSYMRVAAIACILCSSIMGGAIFLTGRKKITDKYNFKLRDFILIGALMNIFLPAVVIFLLLRNIKIYRFSKAIFLSVFLTILYSVSVELNNDHIIKYTLLLLLAIHVLLHFFIKK